MSGWREVTLGEVLNVRHGYAFKGEYFTDDGEYIVLTPGNFYETGGFKQKNGKEKYYRGLVPGGYLLKRGDVVVAMTEQSQGLLGSSATIPTDDLYLHNQRLGLLQITKPQWLDMRFCYHLMNTSWVRRQIQATATGSKVRHTAPERIRSVRVALPTLKTQEVIANILDGLDHLIENNQRRANVLEKVSRAIYRNWFVHFRFPDHGSAAFVDSPLGRIPGGWEVATLGDVALVNDLSRKPKPEEKLAYLDISSLGDRSIGDLAEVTGADAPGRARRVVRAGDVVWSMVRPNRRAHAFLIDPAENWIASTGLAVLTATKITSNLLFEIVAAKAFSDYLISRASGAAYPAVKPKDFELAPVIVPAKDVDRRFADAVRSQHALVWKLREQSQHIAAIRDALLPRLVTGQIDVSHLDIDMVKVPAP